MKRLAILLVAALASLGIVTAAAAHTDTTNPSGYVTVRVTLTDQGMTMRPARAPRGSTAIFLLKNESKSSQVFAVGDASLSHRRGTGFAVKLGKDERKRVLLYLTYRGPLPTKVGDSSSKAAGIFWVS